MANQYLNIPSFDLYDSCRIESEYFMQKEEKQVIKHSTITYSLSEYGELIKDEHLLDQPTDSGFNRSLSEVDDYEKYLNIHNGNVIGWLYIECRNYFLGKRNIKVYESLLQTAEDYRKKLENIKSTEFAQKVFQYFIQVQLEFENWFWQNEIEVPESIVTAGKINKITLKTKGKNNNTKKYKKDIPNEVKLFLKVVKDTKFPFPKLKELESDTEISISTWYRRLNDKEFLQKLNEILIKEREKLSFSDLLLDIYDETQRELSMRLNMNPRPRKNNILDKGKRTSHKSIEEYPTSKEDNFDETDLDTEGYRTSKLFGTYKIILN